MKTKCNPFSDAYLAHVRELAEEIARESGVLVEEVLGRGRTRSVSAARQRLMARLWLEGRSYPEIGRLLDRDHTSCLYGVKQELGHAVHRPKLRGTRIRVAS